MVKVMKSQKEKIKPIKIMSKLLILRKKYELQPNGCIKGKMGDTVQHLAETNKHCNFSGNICLSQTFLSSQSSRDQKNLFSVPFPTVSYTATYERDEAITKSPKEGNEDGEGS